MTEAKNAERSGVSTIVELEGWMKIEVKFFGCRIWFVSS